MTKIRKNIYALETYFKDLEYQVIKFKYFIIVIIALLLEVITVAIFLLNSEKIIEVQLFNASLLFGATSIIIVVMAIGILVLLRVDKTRDRNKIKLLLDYKRDYQKIKNNYINDISRFIKAFNTENDIEAKINYAVVLEDQYSGFLDEFSNLKIPGFLNDLYNYEAEHLQSEKQIYKGYYQLTNIGELKEYSTKSDLAHRNFIAGLGRIERSLKLVI